MSYKRITPSPIAEGGTNASSMTNTDGVVYYDGTKLNTTTVGTAGQVLTSNGAAMAPTFQAAGGGSVTKPLITQFNSNGTWIINTNTVYVEVYVWSGGNGGSSGKQGLTTAANGGGGGAAGQFGMLGMPTGFFNASGETVTVGSGGTGAAGITTTTTNGNPGGVGGYSGLGNFIIGQTVNSSYTIGSSSYKSYLTQFEDSVSNDPVTSGGGNTGAGTSATSIGIPSTGAATLQAFNATGGGGGSGANSTTAQQAGNGGGVLYNYQTTTLVAGAAGGIESGTIGGGNGANGNLTTGGRIYGGLGGGGGGGQHTGGSAGTGGTGGFPGGGGGGGGGSLNGTTSGAGGNGGAGCVIVVEYFS